MFFSYIPLLRGDKGVCSFLLFIFEVIIMRYTIIRNCFLFKYVRIILRKKEHTPLIPSQEGNKKSGLKESISPAQSPVPKP